MPTALVVVLNLPILKIVAALSLFALSLIAGWWPSRHSQGRAHIKTLAFANGVFLGAALFHLLPDADTSMRTHTALKNYPTALLICASTYVLFFILERGTQYALAGRQSEHDYQRALAFLLTGLLSCHALAAGAALGSVTQIGELLVIYSAIIAHKSLTSLSLAVRLQHSPLSRGLQRTLIALFSSMTPLGIIMTSQLMQHLTFSHHALLSAFMNAFSAGTFLYLGTLHGSPWAKLRQHHRHPLQPILIACAGLLLMAVLAIWV